MQVFFCNVNWLCSEKKKAHTVNFTLNEGLIFSELHSLSYHISVEMEIDGWTMEMKYLPILIVKRLGLQNWKSKCMVNY